MSDGWETLLDIIRQNRAERADADVRPPVDCHRCRKPLSTGPHGELFCTFDGWQWDGQPLPKG